MSTPPLRLLGPFSAPVELHCVLGARGTMSDPGCFDSFTVPSDGAALYSMSTFLTWGTVSKYSSKGLAEMTIMSLNPAFASC